jgi:hypothetical protein
VDFGALPGIVPRARAAFRAQDPLGGASGTPTGPAVLGGLEQMRAHLAANPGRRGALIVISDGAPTLCEPLAAEAIAQPITMARQMIPGIPTFLIGVFTAEDIAAGTRLVVDRLASAGGTTAFVLNPMEDITRRLQDAFNQIRTLAVPCEFSIPTPPSGAIDYGRVNVNVQGASAMGAGDVPYVGTAARCDATRGGWYYDMDPAAGGRPTRVVLCERTCRGLQNDENAKVALRFGCKTQTID